jgi:hypothetical protein
MGWEGCSVLAACVLLTLTIYHIFHHVAVLIFHELEQPATKSQDSVGFRSYFVDLFHSSLSASKKCVRSRPFTQVAPLQSLKMASGW